MLYAKIPAKQVKDINGDDVTVEYFTVTARAYNIGVEKSAFIIKYCTTVKTEPTLILRKAAIEQHKLTPEQVATWGTDDSVLLNILAQVAGLTVLEVVSAHIFLNEELKKKPK